MENHVASRARIDISIPSRRLTLHLNGRVHRTYPCALGKPSTPTPSGIWAIRNKTVNPSWQVLGTRWLGLNIPTGNYGIHGTNAPWSIGRYISNGCIRMHNRDVEAVYPLCPIGTAVHITGSYTTADMPGGDGAIILRRGSRNQQVSHLQARLQELGFNTGPIDGIFGPQTERAVMAFQRHRGLTPDGIVGPKTRQALGL